jgi:DeoR/GlpR family transcriptional regulator of sugar metabolism
MFATERLNIIKSYLREHQRLDVHTVSELLNVSEVTIRRDLEKLEEEGYLTRIHGGAVPVQAPDDALVGPANQLAMDDRDFGGRQEQDEIARVASLMVHDGDVVALLNGNINHRLARRLSDRSGLTILTNDILVAMEIAGQAANKAILLGGNIARDERAVFGSLTLANLHNYYVNHLFIEIDGISDQLQLTVRSQEKADLIRESMGCADQAVALCMAASFGKNAFFRLGQAGTVRKIITSPHVPDEYKARLFGAGIQVFTSVNAFEGGV